MVTIPNPGTNMSIKVSCKGSIVYYNDSHCGSVEATYDNVEKCSSSLANWTLGVCVQNGGGATTFAYNTLSDCANNTNVQSRSFLLSGQCSSMGTSTSRIMYDSYDGSVILYANTEATDCSEFDPTMDSYLDGDVLENTCLKLSGNYYQICEGFKTEGSGCYEAPSNGGYSSYSYF